jgi:hypothetical protein
MMELDACKHGFILGKAEKTKLLQIKARATCGLLGKEESRETWDRFYNPEADFKKLVKENIEINKTLKDGNRRLMDSVPRTKLDESYEMFNRAFHTERKVFSPPGMTPTNSQQH